mmetsp:Transcript_131279/g.318898  ORF Transcript_131279/g.318898 Transcript_131279/m.318898 type:complete len:268 (+) Transcript_131279:335-1138(+)
MTHAGEQLPSRCVGEGDMASGSSLLALTRANAALHCLRHAAVMASAIARPVAYNGQNLDFVEVGSSAPRVDRVDDGAAHGSHNGLTLLGAKFSHNLQLLGNLFILQLRGKEVKLELPVALLSHLDKWIRPQVLLRPLRDERLQTEVRAHHCVPAADRQSHQLHRRTCTARGPPETQVRSPAGSGRPRADEAIIVASGAALPVEGHAVRRHAADVLQQLCPGRRGCWRLPVSGEVLAELKHVGAAHAVRAHPLAWNRSWLDLPEVLVV